MRDKSKILAVINTGQRKDEVAEQGSMQRVTYSSSGMIPVSNEYWEMRISAAGETYLFSKYPVAIEYGMTTYVNGGSLDLPSIYDGLPIDNQTLYWEEVTEQVGTDEEGNPIYETTKVLKSAGGGGGTGGGSVLLPLSWSGFSNGSWNGSEAKTIVIPSKLSELDSNDDLTLGGSLNMPSGLAKIKSGEKSIIESYNEGGDTYIIGENYLYLATKALFTIKEGQVYGILHEGNYKDYEYSAKNLNVVDIRNTAPKPSDIETYAVTAQFANTDNPGDGWYSGLSIQGWTNDYRAWQLRSGAWGFASDHLYFRNGVLETWNDWRRVITGDVDGVLDFNLELKGEEGGNIKFVYNSDSAITENKPNDLASIRHALRFPWHGEAYEIGTIRGNASHSDGFGITHQNNHLVWKVNKEQMDVYEDLNVHGNIVINTDNTSAIEVNHRSASQWNFAMTAFNPMMSDGALEIIEFGKGQSAYNAGSIGFKYFSDSSPNNMMTISLFNSDEILNITGHRKVGINTTTPRHDLEVNGQIGVTNDIKLYGVEGDDIESVVNPNGCIKNGIYELTSIRHALRFPWYDDAYEIGTVRSNSEGAWGFGVTYQNNQLVWRVDKEQMDVYGDLRVKNGLIRYNEEEGYFYIDGNLVVSGGVTAFADEGSGSQWIMDVNSLEEVVSDNPFKTYSAKVVSMIASNITNTEKVRLGVKEALDKLEIIEEGLSSITTGSSTTISVLRDTFVSIRSKLIAYGSNYS